MCPCCLDNGIRLTVVFIVVEPEYKLVSYIHSDTVPFCRLRGTTILNAKSHKERRKYKTEAELSSSFSQNIHVLFWNIVRCLQFNL